MGSPAAEDCPRGQYCDTYMLSEPTGNCTEGFYCDLNSIVANPVECSMGHYCPTGIATEQPCPPGTFLSEFEGYFTYYYYQVIFRFPIGLDFLFITFFLHFFLAWTSSLSISSFAISAKCSGLLSAAKYRRSSDWACDPCSTPPVTPSPPPTPTLPTNQNSYDSRFNFLQLNVNGIGNKLTEVGVVIKAHTKIQEPLHPELHHCS